jgi:hypothetical protein
VAKQTLVVFDAMPAPTMIYSAHPTEAKNANYQAPIAKNDDATLLPIGTMHPNDDGSWTIRLSSRPSGNMMVVKPLA